MEIKETYMRRALELARKGQLYAHPNPMVGAVIVDSQGNIIGEGYHRRCGEAHAEVNAINSVADPSLLADSTMYVTLEPCAHYGRTGPCSRLIVERGIPRVVVGVRDPFDKVDGKGIEIMREAGVEVTVGVLERECRNLNMAFFTAHTMHRPFVCLKWAQSADGWLASAGAGQGEPVRFSTPLTQTLVHQWRARFDAIMVGSGTVLADNPGLDVRLWSGPSPRPVILDRRHRIGDDHPLVKRGAIMVREDKRVAEMLRQLYDQGITSVMVEGGAEVLASMVEAGLWDIARVETAPLILGPTGEARAPHLPELNLAKTQRIDGNTLKYYSQSPYFDVKNL
ncbi:MAG: bifunctional diaminohydroxyphosphoribosylaminopyrimidine deaminase/5-amino-6-(5-phosphoribosylamino)uracil reductase RibD [Bacteroidales bacterium]|nr:bifunctional diaminohydroxyphosphoribosylaminopyrimidine deaminase/5-amino-6-(5-phosphoribosylamino)uracil reductase RibD [Bacteroidales bacterium]